MLKTHKKLFPILMTDTLHTALLHCTHCTVKLVYTVLCTALEAVTQLGPSSPDINMHRTAEIFFISSN